MKIQVKLLNNDAKLPIYATQGAAGCDIFATEDFEIEATKVKPYMSVKQEKELQTGLTTAFRELTSQSNLTMANLEGVSRNLAEVFKDTIEGMDYSFTLGRAVVDTGIAFGIPIGSNIELELRSKSGLAFKQEIHAFNGTLDEDYTQELKILMFNPTNQPIKFKKGEKVAQGVFKHIIQAEFELVDEIQQEVIDNPERERNTAVKGVKRNGGFGSTGKTQEGTEKL